MLEKIHDRMLAMAPYLMISLLAGVVGVFIAAPFLSWTALGWALYYVGGYAVVLSVYAIVGGILSLKVY